VRMGQLTQLTVRMRLHASALATATLKHSSQPARSDPGAASVNWGSAIGRKTKRRVTIRFRLPSILVALLAVFGALEPSLKI
jgi:hypothetical protein